MVDHRPERDGPGVAAAVRAYRAALRLLPADVRERIGAEATDDVRRLATEARRQRGVAGLLGVAGGAVGDLLRRAPGEWWARALDRSHDTTTGWTTMWMRETKQALRSLARRPGFSAMVIGTLALGIAANVAIFTVVNAVLLRPLPYPGSERIVRVMHHAPGLNLPDLENSPGLVNLYRDELRTVESFGAVDSGLANLTGGDRPARIRTAALTPSMFDVLRTYPARGRPFTEAEGLPDGAAVAVLSHETWRDRFGSDPDVLGSTVELDGNAHEVVGVMPADFDFPMEGTEVFVPLVISPDGPFGTFGLHGYGRLAEGMDLAAARRELDAIQGRLVERFELTPERLEGFQWSVSVQSYRDHMVGDIRAALWIVLGTVAVLLLIACANVANLFLVRAEGRQREVALRAALGAGRGRLAVGFLSESMVSALAAGAVALVLAVWGVRLLVAFGPPELPRLHEVGVDPIVFLYALGVSVAAGLLFGSIPVLRYLGAAFSGVLRDGGRGVTEGRERHRTRNLLVAAQLALALVLLTGSGLMLRSFQKLRTVDLGVDPEGILVVEVSAGEGVERAEASMLYHRMVEEARALPGVVVAGAVNSLPMDPRSVNGGSFYIESRPRDEDGLPPVSFNAVMTPGHFEALGIEVVAGRAPRASDNGSENPVIWVNETFVRSFLDGDVPAALGERIRLDEEGEYMEVVGVVEDVRHFSPDEEPSEMMYTPILSPGSSRSTVQSMSLLLKVDGPPTALAAPARDLVARIAPQVPVTRTRTMDEVVSASMARTSFIMTLLGIAAAVALLLGTVGVYGVISYVVSRRTREIGVRMALGARREDVQRMVVLQGTTVAVLGTAVGLAAAVALTRLMESLLYGVSPTDPVTFASVTGTLLAVAVLASWLPARRASRVDPSRALAAE